MTDYWLFFFSDIINLVNLTLENCTNYFGYFYDFLPAGLLGILQHYHKNLDFRFSEEKKSLKWFIAHTERTVEKNIIDLLFNF